MHRVTVPLPRPRPAEAPSAEPEKPAADKHAPEADKPAEQAAPAPQPSACRLALTETIAIAPSVPDIHGPGDCGGEDLVRLEAARHGMSVLDTEVVGLIPQAVLAECAAHYLQLRGKTDLLRILSEVDELSDQVDITYLQQKEPRGLGHAVWTARRLVEGESCAVLLADDVILGDSEPCLKQLIDAHQKTGATVLAVRRFPRSEVGRYGVVAIDGSQGRVHEVTDMVEKPEAGTEPSDLCIVGRYVLTPAVFAELSRSEPGAGQEIQLTDAIKRTLGSHPVVALEFEGDYYDTGTVPGYLRANLTLAMKREGLREALAPLLRELLDGA